MLYALQFKPRALKDLEGLSSTEEHRVTTAIEKLKDGIVGDVKRLRNFSPALRLRVGNYRVLFEVENNVVVIYRILHRSVAYKN